MKLQSLYKLTLSLVTASSLVSVAQAGVVYTELFEGQVGPEWSSNAVSATPVGNRNFLGQFGAQEVQLSLTGLAAHQSVGIDFDLFIINTWDGNSVANGPDTWSFSANGLPLLNTTFRNIYPGDVLTQAYPDNVGGNNAP